MIDGVLFKDLVTHGDDRGFFRELIRVTDPFFAAGFGQMSHSLVNTGVVKAWHGHTRQSQWTYVASGLLKVAIHDCRPPSPTRGQTMEFLLGDGQQSRIYLLPPGVVHGYRCLAGPAHVFYVTSGTYDLPEEIRLPADEATIAYRWNDRQPPGR